MFRGNIPISIERNSGFDPFGQPKLSSVPPKQVYGSVITLKSVKGFSAKTASDVYEVSNVSVVLLPPNVEIEIGDKLTVNGVALKVTVINERFDTFGKYNHNQVDCVAWR